MGLKVIQGYFCNVSSRVHLKSGFPASIIAHITLNLITDGKFIYFEFESRVGSIFHIDQCILLFPTDLRGNKFLFSLWIMNISLKNIAWIESLPNCQALFVWIIHTITGVTEAYFRDKWARNDVEDWRWLGVRSNKRYLPLYDYEIALGFPRALKWDRIECRKIYVIKG